MKKLIELVYFTIATTCMIVAIIKVIGLIL